MKTLKLTFLGAIIALSSLTSATANEDIPVNSCMDDAWDFGTEQGHLWHGGAYGATNWYYKNVCEANNIAQ